MPTMATSPGGSGWRSARWTLPRITLLATLLLPMIAIVGFLGVQIILFPEVGPMFALFVALAIANVWSADRWLQLIGGLAVFAFGALNAVFIASELMRPDHYPTYFLGWLAVLCALAGLVAGVAGFMDARQHRLGSPHWASVGATLLLLGVGFAIGLFTASAATRFVDSGTAATVALTPEADIMVEVAEFAYGADGTITIASGVLTRIALTNLDGEAHTFTIDALGINADLLAGKTTEVWVQVATPGSYEIYCKPHSSALEGGGREGMSGTLTVV